MGLLSKKKPHTAQYWADKMWDAIAENERDKLKEYLAQPEADINATTTDGGYLIYRAVRDGDVHIFNYLLENGADIALAEQQNKFPLICSAAQYSVRGYRIVEKLLELGYDVNMRSENGSTPLHYAARAGAGDIVRLLLDHSADPNIRDHYSSTAADDADQKYPRIADQIRQHPSFHRVVIKSEWEISGEEEITHISEKKAAGFIITEIFDFRMKTYISVVFNENAKTQSHVSKSFSELAETKLLDEAAAQMKRRGIDVSAGNTLFEK